MTNLEIAHRVIDREVRPGQATTNDPRDPGRLTHFGLTFTTYRRYVPGATVEAFLALTRDDVAAFFVEHFIVEPHFDWIADEQLREQVVDFGVTSSPERSTRVLQEVIEVPGDGVLGPVTLHAIAAHPDPRSVSNQFAVARALFYARIAQNDINDWFKRGAPLDVAAFDLGWVTRALSFVR